MEEIKKKAKWVIENKMNLDVNGSPVEANIEYFKDRAKVMVLFKSGEDRSIVIKNKKLAESILNELSRMI